MVPEVPVTLVRYSDTMHDNGGHSFLGADATEALNPDFSAVFYFPCRSIDTQVYHGSRDVE